MVCTGCCATLDHIVTYLFKKVTNKGDQFSTIDQSLSIFITSQGKKSRSNNPSSGDNDSLVAVVKMRPEILQQMLQTVRKHLPPYYDYNEHIAGVKYHHVRGLP